MTITNCDFCGKKTEVKRTQYGTSFGYVRLICKDCAKEFGYVRLICKDCAKELGAKIIGEDEKKKEE